MSRTRVFILSALAAMMCAMSFASAGQASSATGDVRFVNEAKSDFDRFTSNPSPAEAQWQRDHYYRQKTYAPYFDTRTSWYGNAWAYKDLYALYVNDTVAAAHPDWVLKDGNGRKLYIPFACKGGTCPQYAADVGNPEFRAFWIAEAKATVAQGYKGLFVDDVNMEFRVGNGNGDEVAPIDPRTGSTMSLDTWRRYVADFVVQIRQQVTGVEIAQNPIWYSDKTDPNVARALKSADTINLERGFNDAGLTGGGGKWGLETFLKHIDWLHAQGKAVVLDSYTDNEQGAEYNLAGYFLINGERDGFRTDYRRTPDNWWTGYDVKLGAAKGERYDWNGLLRRDFANGYVLLNQPGSPTRTIDTPGGRGPDGAARDSVTLGGGQGAVVVSPTAPKSESTGLGIVLKPVPNPIVKSASKSSRTRGRLRKAVLLKGRIRGRAASSTKLRITIHRKRRGRWVKVRSARIKTIRGSRFSKLIRRLPRGSYRVTARPAKAHGKIVAVKRFRVRR